MSKCRINKYKAGNGISFSCQTKSLDNGSLNNSLASKLAAREAQDSQLWSSTSETSETVKTVKTVETAITIIKNPQTRVKDIDTILNGDF